MGFRPHRCAARGGRQSYPVSLGTPMTDFRLPSVFDFVCGQEQLDAAEQYRQSPLLSNLGCWLSVPTARTFTGVQTFASESVTTTDVVQGSGILAAYAVQIQTTQLATMPATTAVRFSHAPWILTALTSQHRALAHPVHHRFRRCLPISGLTGCRPKAQRSTYHLRPPPVASPTG